MSCHPVSPAHLDVLVNTAMKFGLVVSEDDAVSAGTMLWEENYRSVNHRYRENNPAPRYLPTMTATEFHPVAVAKAIHAYLYQIAEPPDWRDTEAYAWCERLESMVESTMAADDLVVVRDRDGRKVSKYRLSALYERSPWLIDSMDEVPTRGRPSPMS